MKTPMPSVVALFSQGRRGGGQHRSYSSSYFADLSSDSPKEKAAPDEGHDLLTINTYVGLALTSFKPTLRLVDYIDAALTAHDAAIAVTLLERTEGVTNFHGACPSCRGARIAPWVAFRPEWPAKSWWTILGSNQ